ncbi:hypothetical protein [Natroniella sp. ANB-PHB2]|uniref:hypothetical protein n=1 Tax=Natroniella sp. ANB-PHB2 TaxID=3384444 RepID=UPI0038D3B9D1
MDIEKEVVLIAAIFAGLMFIITSIMSKQLTTLGCLFGFVGLYHLTYEQRKGTNYPTRVLKSFFKTMIFFHYRCIVKKNRSTNSIKSN